MKKTTTILMILCLAFPSLIIGQGETSNWYFGNGAGITFNGDGSVTATTDGKLNTFEGCATISDSAGDLLFYTDGIIVYDQNHRIMENGRGLYGDPSSTQSAIIVPKPGDPDIFFIFTVDTKVTEEDPDRGLNYSIVDISLNGGNGAVTSKNIPLLADCSEKIAAVVKDCTELSIWVITLASASGDPGRFNTYHAFEINTAGVKVTSVKSTFEDLAIEDPRGYLKLSADGTRMVSANARSGLFAYDFDTASGKVSNQQEIEVSGRAPFAYGIEFAPKGNYLYVHSSNDVLTETGHFSSLVQYNLEAVDVSRSRLVLDEHPIFRGALQLGNNGKIFRTIASNYLEGTPYLGVINNPNSQGNDADYQHNAISLKGKMATQGLPPFIQSFFNKIDLITDEEGNKISSLALCSGEGFLLEAENIPGAQYEWEKDGIPLSYSTNILEIPSVIDTDSGRYRLKVTLADPLECPIIGEALIEVSPLPKTNDILLTQCDIDLNNDSDGITTFDLTQIDAEGDYELTFYESIDDRNNDNPIPNPENYTNTIAFNQTLFYRATNSLGCYDFGLLALEVHPTIINESPFSPLMVCDEDALDSVLESTFDLETLRQIDYSNFEVTFYLSLQDATFEDNAIPPVSYRSNNKTIYVRLEQDGQCQGVERLELIVNPLPNLQFDTIHQVCSDGQPLQLFAPEGFDSYRWYQTDGSQIAELGHAYEIEISKGGSYKLEVGTLYENNGQTVSCTTSSDFTVLQSNRAIFDEIDISDVSDNNSIEVMVSGEGDYEYSLDGNIYQDSRNFENVDAGFYTVFARDKKGCGITEEEISVIGFPKFFTPNGDGANDSWQVIGVKNNLVEGEIAIFDRYGKLMKQLNLKDPGWDGTFDGRLLPASDYWFSIAFSNGKEFKGHFALKR